MTDYVVTIKVYVEADEPHVAAAEACREVTKQQPVKVAVYENRGELVGVYWVTLPDMPAVGNALVEQDFSDGMMACYKCGDLPYTQDEHGRWLCHWCMQEVQL